MEARSTEPSLLEVDTHIVRRTAELLVVSLVGLVLTHCAPNNAKEIRELKPTTLGLIGGEYRPDGTKAFGLTGSYSGPVEMDADAYVDDEDDEDRELELKNSFGVSAFYHHYIWETSAFFVGAGLSHESVRYEFQERTTAYTEDDETYADVEYSDAATYVRVPLGWNWIWDNGITLLLDFGPGFRVAQTTSLDDDGEDQGVD